MSTSGHRYSVHDRGEEHVHRFTPRCSCGWVGQHRKNRDAAAKEWRDGHLRNVARPKRHVRRDGALQPRPLTPRADLPEALR